MARHYRIALTRMEARGEIRGSRFVGGLAGEQFALPEAVSLFKKYEKDESDSYIYQCL